MYMSTSTRSLSRIGLSGIILTVASIAMAQPGLDLVTGSTLSSSLNYLNAPTNNVLIKGNSAIPVGNATSTSAGGFPTIGSTQTISFTGTPIIRASVLGLGFGATTDTPTLTIPLLGAGGVLVSPTMNVSYDPLTAPELTYIQAGTALFAGTSGGVTHQYSLSGLSGNATQAGGPPTIVNLTGATGTITYLGVIPEPTTMALLGTGLIAGAVMRRRRAIKK
jgi:hypothetical protein